MIQFFIDELNKIAKEDDTTFQKIVHHPLTQTLGYGALAGEGAHALAERGTFGQRAQSWAHRPTGKALGTGSIGASAAFLGAEGLSALQDMWKRKPPQPMQKESSDAGQSLVVRLAIKGLEGFISGGAGALAGWQVMRLLSRNRKRRR